MSGSDKVVAFIPCKGHSRRVERKNVQFVGGMPLWLRKAEQMRRLVDEVWIDTDDEGIALSASVRGYNVMRGNPVHSGSGDGHELFAWEVQEVERIRGLCSQPLADVYVQALCTAPFLSDATVEVAVNQAESCGSAFAATIEQRYSLFSYLKTIPASDALKPTESDAMALYAVHCDRFDGKRKYADSFPVYIHGVESLDVDYPHDLEHAQAYALGVNEVEQRRLRGLECVLSSALLSDCLVEQGIVGCTMDFKVRQAKAVLGRACTLKLTEGEGASIYDALGHYDWCMPGNILCVRGSDAAAYFGELNSRLAYRAGASACLVDGLTRDTADTVVPVWSQGVSPYDCRDTLRVAGIGVPVEMCGVEVHHGDLIFADGDGAVRIPRKHEARILRDALERVENEDSIKLSVARGMSVEHLRNNNGNF